MGKRKITLISSFFESPYHRNRAPYNEQLFLEMAQQAQIKIIRPIAWTDIVKFKKGKGIRNAIGHQWHGIPILFPTFPFLPRIGLRVNGLIYFLTILVPFIRQWQKPDLIYTTWAYPDAYAARILAKLIRCPYVVRVHGSDINDLAQRGELKGKIRRVLADASMIVSPSRALKEKMVELGVPDHKIAVIYSGVNREKFYPEEKQVAQARLGLSGKKRITYIGNFKAAKGVVDLVAAAVRLANKRDDFELCLIGKGDVRSLLPESHHESGVLNIVGEINHGELSSWINASDGICLPSYAEGVPNVLLEAMACETNIVASNVGGIPEIVSTPDELVEPGDIDKLVEQLNATLDRDGFVTTPAVELRSYTELSKDILSRIDVICEKKRD